MELSFLPIKILSIINKYDFNNLYEIRLRENFGITFTYKGKKIFLPEITCKREDIDYIIDEITEKSVYAFNDYIKNGFITTKDGIRIGLCGQCVFDGDKIVTIKNISSLNIRIPHFVKECSNRIFNTIVIKNEILNTLIISPPFCGKTTIIKDISLKINEDFNKNILIIDERGEFAEIKGKNIDKISFSNKSYAFNFALRSMSPDIVITDELSTLSDWLFIKTAVYSGIKVIATVHSDSISDLKSKNNFILGLFDRYFILKKDNFGIIDKIFNKNLEEI